MSFPTRFEGGTLIRRDPERLIQSAYIEAYCRIEDPLDIFLSAGACTMFWRAAVLALSSPDTQWAEVAVRDFAQRKFVLVAPTTADNPRKVELSIKDGSAWIRKADDVLIAGGIAAQPGRNYRMDAHLVEDSEFKWVVAMDWTNARAEGRDARTAADQAAPGKMGPT